MALWLVLLDSLCGGVCQTLGELLYIRENVNGWGEEIKVGKELDIQVRLWFKEFGLFNSSQSEAKNRGVK